MGCLSFTFKYKLLEGGVVAVFREYKLLFAGILLAKS